MFVIIGLGNPGERYAKSRHNIGFMVVDRINERFSGNFKKGKGKFFLSKINIKGLPVLLIKPLTYMNLSGEAVQQVMSFYKTEDFSKILIVLDDFNLPFGTLRLRPGGSDGGQKGLASILQTLKTEQIPRLRIGIGGQIQDATNYVLASFNRQEQKQLPQIIDWAADAAESFVTTDIAATMNFYNRDLNLNHS
ncbi:MAG: aminoacyl-tRNA hydrolase [Calditrichae bacterium]|nr:aminoacyl-tRNA hydrolase [Calditrichia bacterium]NIW95069.1 aminoacyl-tRNA hydrolase [Phycisphaerae bacterium]